MVAPPPIPSRGRSPWMPLVLDAFACPGLGLWLRGSRVAGALVALVAVAGAVLLAAGVARWGWDLGLSGWTVAGRGPGPGLALDGLKVFAAAWVPAVVASLVHALRRRRGGGGEGT